MRWISVNDYLPPHSGNYDCSSIKVPVLYTYYNFIFKNGRSDLKLGCGSVDMDCGDNIWFVDGDTRKTEVKYWLDDVPDFPNNY